MFYFFQMQSPKRLLRVPSSEHFRTREQILRSPLFMTDIGRKHSRVKRDDQWAIVPGGKISDFFFSTIRTSFDV